MRDADHAVRAIVADAIRHSGKSRDQIADQMSASLGRQVTAHVLNAFTAPSKEAVRFPAAYVLVFCQVTGDDRLQRLLLGEHLCALLELGERAFAAINKEKVIRGAGAAESA